MNTKTKVTGITFATIVLASAFVGMAFAQTGPFQSPQTIGVQVFDSHGMPLVNASVQGVMYKPPNEGAGTSTLFVAKTNAGGFASISNLTALKGEANAWAKYQGAAVNALSHPDLLLFITYHTTSGIYFTMGSVNMTAANLMHGKSFKATVHLPLNKKNRLFKSAQQATAQPNATPASTTLPIEIPVGTDYYWEEDAANITPMTDIPMTFAYIVGNGGAYVEASGSTSLNYNVGYALSPGSVSTATYKAGSGSGYTTSSSATYIFNVGESVYSSNSGSTGYTYIVGQVEGAHYTLYESGSITPINTFYDTGIVNVQISSDNEIANGAAYGSPAAINSIEEHGTFIEQTSGQAGTGAGQFGTQYEIKSQALVEQYTDSDTAWINLGIGLGAILISLIPGLDVVGAVIGVIALLYAGVTYGSGSSASMGYVQYNAATNYDINTFVMESSSQYTLTNGYTGYVPMMGVEVDAYQPSSSSGGGGCVLSGTEITLANGTLVPVQDLHTGMKTLSYDTVNGSLIQSTVTSVTETNVSHVLEINKNIYISGMGDQPVYVKLQNGTTEWQILGKLNYNMSIFDPSNNTWIPITSITMHNGNFSVYDVNTARQFISNGHTEVFNDYIANGILVDIKVA